VVEPGLAHHITQRGNNQQKIYDNDFDCGLFLEILGDRASKYGLAIWGYCLMPNHFHLIAVPDAENTLARTIRRVEADYARYLNTRRGTNGHLWQARFYSTPMDEQYRWRALAYVERNPVRAAIVDHAIEYRWSSAAARLGIGRAPDWLELGEWQRHWSPEEWRRLLVECGSERAFAGELRDATLGGLPLGSALTERLEQERGVRLRRGRGGRPMKDRSAAVADARQETFAQL
jgi:putative transposase